MSYRNITYHPRDELIRLFTWDEEGNRIVVEHTYNPYLYVEINDIAKASGTSLFKTPVKKLEFRTQFDRLRYIKENNLTRVFENISCTQQFLIDRYWETNESPDFSKNPLKMVLVDIETYSSDGSFPNIEQANHPINVITIYDSLSKRYITWGAKEYTCKDTQHTYYHCPNESKLLSGFLGYLQQDYPDIISGWNSHGFDIPYIITRCRNLLGDDVKQLSPVGNIYSRTFPGDFGKQVIRWFVDGVSLLDYLDIYKRFAPERESYKLDNIAQLEIGESKVKFNNMDLFDLAENDWETFIDYNLQDVKILVKLEEKLQYLGLVRMLAYVGLTSFEAAMGSLSVINGAIVIRGRQRNQIIPTFIRNEPDHTNPGAYVAVPKRGFQECVVSYDANSLYPNVIISLNLSPETKVGKIVTKNDTSFEIRLVNGKLKIIEKDVFDKFCKEHEIAVTKADVLFSQKEKGIIPEIVDYYYQRRTDVKNDYIKKKKELAAIEAKIKKIQLKK